MASNPIFHKWTKQIEINCYFVRHKVTEGSVKHMPIRSQQQLAHVFTKPQPSTLLFSLLSKMTVKDIHSPSRRGVLQLSCLKVLTYCYVCQLYPLLCFINIILSLFMFFLILVQKHVIMLHAVSIHLFLLNRMHADGFIPFSRPHAYMPPYHSWKV